MTAVTAHSPPHAAVLPVAPPPRSTVRLIVCVSGALLVVVALCAVIVHLTAARETRAWLGLGFAGVPATAPEALRIFAHNAGAMVGIFGLSLVAQTAARRSPCPAALQRWIRAAGEALLAAAVAANLLVVGAALGAYGARMVRAMLPHSPVELAAFALALALYVQGRERALPVAHLASTAAAALGLLAIAAFLEALVSV